MKTLTFIFLMLLILSGCKPSYITSGIRQIDSLAVSVNDLSLMLSAMDTISMREKYSLYQTSITQMKNFHEDHFEKDEWQSMTQYGNIGKALKVFFQKLPAYRTETAFAKNQLENLKYDLSQKLITREQFSEYFEREKEAVNSLQFFEAYHIAAMTQLESFDTLYPRIVVIIENHYNKKDK
jgi:hypothetical protein